MFTRRSLVPQLKLLLQSDTAGRWIARHSSSQISEIRVTYWCWQVENPLLHSILLISRRVLGFDTQWRQLSRIAVGVLPAESLTRAVASFPEVGFIATRPRNESTSWNIGSNFIPSSHWCTRLMACIPVAVWYLCTPGVRWVLHTSSRGEIIRTLVQVSISICCEALLASALLFHSLTPA